MQIQTYILIKARGLERIIRAELGEQAAKEALQQMKAWDKTIFEDARNESLKSATKK